MARVYDIIEETDGVMNVFAGERIVESYLYGAVGYVNPYGNYIPRASHRICDFITEGRLEDAKQIERVINRMQAIINEGHPTYGHQCYSKALAAAAGYPVGDVRPPLTTFTELGQEGARPRRAADRDHGRARRPDGAPRRPAAAGGGVEVDAPPVHAAAAARPRATQPDRRFADVPVPGGRGAGAGLALPAPCAVRPGRRRHRPSSRRRP